MGKATEVLKDLSALPPRSEDERFGRALPPLKLKPELVVELSEPTKIADGLTALEHGEIRNVLVRDSAGDLEGVLVPVERYVQLVGRELQQSRALEMRDDGRLQPEGFTDADVELSDPNVDWPQPPPVVQR